MSMQSAFMGILAAAENARAREAEHENDYVGDDGLLYCGNCHTRRQMPLEIPCGIGLKIVPVMCKCAIERREAEEAQRKAFEEQDRIKRLRRVGITSTMYEKTLADDDGSDPKTGGIVRRYVEKRAEMQERNIGLLFHGGTGGGKTFWASCIANALIDSGTSALITTIPALITAMQADFEAEKPRILEQIANVRFLVLDDIGFERKTQYAAEKMFEIIDTRYRAGRPLIVTTNLTLEEIKNPESMEYQRVFDRIIEMCTPLHVSADGRRMSIARDKSADARRILGI